MSESSSERDRLQRELEELDDKIRQERTKSFSWGWGVRVGHRSLGIRLPIYSGTIFFGFVTFNIAAFIVGVILIFLRGTFRELGIAVVVGSLFAFGSFIAQWWTVQVQFEDEFADRVHGIRDRQQQLGDMRNRVTDRLDELSQSGDSSD